MKNKIFIIILSVLVWTSCDEDTFTTTLSVDPPDFEKLMVANCFINNLENRVLARIGRTYPVLEEVSKEEALLDSAEVEIQLNGEVILSMVMDESLEPESNYIGFLQEALIPGETYDLTVRHEEYGEATANQVMPTAVPITKVEITRDAGRDIDGFEVSSVEITFDDPVDMENYYACSVWVIDSVGQNVYPVYSQIEDPQIQYGYDENFILEDASFNGKTFTIRLLIDRYDYDRVKENGAVVWKNITADFYQYSASLERQSIGSDFQGFSEPTLIYSNVKNGLGCFALSHVEIVNID